jgi:hypothetical protein
LYSYTNINTKGVGFILILLLKNMKNILPLILLATFVLGGCGGKKTSPVRTQATLQHGKTRYPIPTAYEITNCIDKAGAAFVIGITNPTANAEKYLTTTQKAIGIGIYGTDLAYASTYNIEQETRNYLQVLYQLTNSLNIQTNFNADLVQKVEDNIGNKDTVISIVSQSFYDTYDFLVDNGQDDISLLVLVGTWIEGMYVATYLATTSASTAEMLNIVADQKESLAELLALFEGRDAEELQVLYEELAVFEDSLTVPEGSYFTLEKAILLREKIEKLRNSLI